MVDFRKVADLQPLPSAETTRFSPPGVTSSMVRSLVARCSWLLDDHFTGSFGGSLIAVANR